MWDTFFFGTQWAASLQKGNTAAASSKSLIVISRCVAGWYREYNAGYPQYPSPLEHRGRCHPLRPKGNVLRSQKVHQGNIWTSFVCKTLRQGLDQNFFFSNWARRCAGLLIWAPKSCGQQTMGSLYWEHSRRNQSHGRKSKNRTWPVLFRNVAIYVYWVKGLEWSVREDHQRWPRKCVRFRRIIRRAATISRVQSDVCAQNSSRGVTVVSSVLSVGAMYTVRYYEDREHEALCSAGEKWPHKCVQNWEGAQDHSDRWRYAKSGLCRWWCRKISRFMYKAWKN